MEWDDQEPYVRVQTQFCIQNKQISSPKLISVQNPSAEPHAKSKCRAAWLGLFS